MLQKNVFPQCIIIYALLWILFNCQVISISIEDDDEEIKVNLVFQNDSIQENQNVEETKQNQKDLTELVKKLRKLLTKEKNISDDENGKKTSSPKGSRNENNIVPSAFDGDFDTAIKSDNFVNGISGDVKVYKATLSEEMESFPKKNKKVSQKKNRRENSVVLSQNRHKEIVKGELGDSSLQDLSSCKGHNFTKPGLIPGTKINEDTAYREYLIDEKGVIREMTGPLSEDENCGFLKAPPRKKLIAKIYKKIRGYDNDGGKFYAFGLPPYDECVGHNRSHKVTLPELYSIKWNKDDTKDVITSM